MKDGTLDSSDGITFVMGGLTGGGAERVAVTLITHWFEKGRNVKIITRRGPEHDFYSIPEGIPRIVLGDEADSANKFIGLLKNIGRIFRLRKAVKIADTPIVLSFLTKNNILTILASAGLGKRVVVSERSDTTREQHSRPWGWLRRKTYKHAGAVTANTQNALEGMKGYVPGPKLAYLPNPVQIPDQQARPEDSNKILNIGRLVPEKAQHLIIEALGKTSGQHEDWSLEILGEGEEREKLQALARELNCSGRISLPGMVKELSHHYLSAGIFVLSSEYEGTPNVLLEAMAHGLPCIVSDSLPGALKLIKEDSTGSVFKSGDASDLSARLERLMENPELRSRLGNAARERVHELNPTRVSEAWDDVLFGRRAGSV